ncbi:MAG: nicotinate (nicotinamide) nucleotide adenylyltransferase [Chlorobi bacterium]|nr:MAG: nicotinate (nicotinamide) nucleotide adenylyltransferase [Bacteroidota bacterium]KXK35294.1 MAG: nicotinate (nicotinamide) nucleotide adenylyltransferase [Chlorobi bacterium OLB6]MBE2264900.1 nicotinate (nicotinamide) nucleotide adenylyltransferase [Flavobacteriales bacterium]MBL1160798.1 nicotinate (nicotinamide) nucleotide adenylyltransferase [Chlorobiota bacterium]MBW7853149.1 nicotinate (nicotinamide) nucleotide adenylyltransferase [Candidatus Kapabacteria bacterium]MCC6331362.1 ni
MRIGIVGGTFNPIHVAHLVTAECFTSQMKLDICYFVPAYQSPFKDAVSVVSPEHRSEMVNIAISDNPKFVLLEYEIQRAGVSYTIDTITELQRMHSDADLFLLTGTDHAVMFTQWKDWTEICLRSQLCIVRRPLAESTVNEQMLTAQLTVQNRAPIWISAPLMSVSSTEIRTMIAQHQSIRYLVPDRVREFIAAHRLYQEMLRPAGA